MTRGSLRVKFWGVRGSIPSPGPTTVNYGGNTACVEIEASGQTLVLDAGTGIRALGDELERRAVHDIQLLFSHCHFDHIEGLPFFAPLYNAKNHVTMWSGHLDRLGATQEMVAGLIASPYFPVGLAAFRANIAYRDFKIGTTLELGSGIRVTTTTLNHPGRATGYRISHAGKSVCYVTDVEHRDGPDETLIGFVRNTNILIYDSMYTGEEYPRYRGFGHSTPEEAVKLASAGDVERLLMFHHFPGRTDNDLAILEKWASVARPQTLFAREGMEIVL